MLAVLPLESVEIKPRINCAKTKYVTNLAPGARSNHREF